MCDIQLCSVFCLKKLFCDQMWFLSCVSEGKLSKVGKSKLIAPTCITQVLLQLRRLPATCVSKGHLHQSLVSNIHMCYAPLSDSPIPLLSTNSGSLLLILQNFTHTSGAFLCCLCKGSPIYMHHLGIYIHVILLVLHKSLNYFFWRPA